MAKNRKKENFIWNLIGTGLNAFSSLFYMIIITRINGSENAGIFAFSFSIACLFYLIGSFNGRVYQVTESNKITDKEFVYNKIFTCLIMLIISILFVAIKQYNIYKTLIIAGLCMLKALEAYVEVVYGILQKNEQLYKTGISFSIKNVIGIFLFLIIDLITHNILLSIVGTLVVHLIIFLIYDVQNIKVYKIANQEFNKNNFFTILKNGFLSFLINFLSLFLINSSRYVMDTLMSSNFQTIFSIILMPATVVSLMAQFIIFPYLTTVKKFIIEKNFLELRKIVVKFLLCTLSIGFLCIIIAYLIGIPVINILYGLNLSEYLNCLIIIMMGAIFTAAIYILSNILISLRKMIFPVPCYFIICIISIFLSRFLIINYGILGASYNYLICMATLFIVFFIYLMIYLNSLIKKEGV